MKVRTLFAVIMTLLIAVPVLHAGSILVVDDDNNYNNESKLYDALDSKSILYDSYDCSAEGGSPDSAAMSEYDLVIWFTGSDGGSTYFWNGADSDNPEIIGYLNQGGKLWSYGIDILYDRYGSAPDTFSTGDFVYDYMGIASYDAQSHLGADAGGVPQLEQTADKISTIDLLTWTVTELWYVDGVTPAPGAVSHYTMGPDTYVYSGLTTVLSNSDGNFTLLSAHFKNWNLADAIRADWIEDVIDWFDLPQLPVTADILVVDDDNYQNYETTFYESLERKGYVFDTFDTDALGSPDAATLSTYKLVIWYAGNDGSGLNFWDGVDGDNLAIITYLNNGGRLWINGLDLIYDRYGSAPDEFGPGEFIHDYMGLKSYDAQSKANDGSVGAPLIAQLPTDPITAVDTIEWRFTSAWYIDGVTSNYRSFDNYAMGPDDYAMAGNVNVCHTIGDNSVVLNSFFNFNHIVNDSIRDAFLVGVMEWFDEVATGNTPTASNLTAPADNSSMEIFVADSADVNFVWDASTDVEDAVNYRFLLGKSPEDIACIMVVDQATPGYTMNERDLYAMIPPFENEIDLYWQVLAYDSDHNITESPVNTFKVIRDPGPGPSPFVLLGPDDGALIRAHADHAWNVPFTWQPSIDPDGMAITYTLKVMDLNGTELYTLDAGSDTSAAIASADLLTILAADTVKEVAWIVIANDGDYDTNALTAHKMKLVNAPPQLVSILVVDDDDRYNNETKVYEALDNVYYAYDTFDAPTNGRSPTLEELTPYDLVIWFAGSDGVDIYFWNANEEDNGVIPQYLDQGGRMWAFGADILYDRYGGAPDFFSPGDMIYDYFGTSGYLAQTWLQDDNVGNSMLLKAAVSTVTEMDTIRWGGTSGITKYIDGCSLGEGAMPDLVMGPDDYQLAGMANSYHKTDGNYITMSTWFNPYYMVSSEERTAFVSDVVSWFEKTTSPAALPAPTLTAPATGTPIVLNSKSDEVTFAWDRVSSTEPVVYQLVVSSDALDIVPVVISTRDTSATLDGKDLFDLSGHGPDTLNLEWKVIAMTPMAGYGSSVAQSHSFVEAIPEAPEDFALLLPVADDTLRFGAFTSEIDFTWEPSIDPDGDVVNYQFLLFASANDTLFNINTSDTSATLITGDLAEVIARGGIIPTFWKVIAGDGDFATSSAPRMLYFRNTTVDIAEANIPDSYMLYQNYPNPFNPSTQIRYDLPEATQVSLTIYDITGKVVNQIESGLKSAGSYTVQWNGVSETGHMASTGLYLCRIQTDQYSSVVKMLYLK